MSCFGRLDGSRPLDTRATILSEEMMPLLCISQMLGCGNSICHEGFGQVRFLLIHAKQWLSHSTGTWEAFICKAVSTFHQLCKKNGGTAGAWHYDILYRLLTYL
ncbi:hypothetical protein TNCT_503611 [Trichonephila clavata]|uniref:Uncharacterized protein n=1 Tax=Trichonephila clavata TaxID=2740835 RepID=A0A8X6I1J5_TRICU|nr:hypothetical protein TNCT_503611 [Trichonephila clavata]